MNRKKKLLDCADGKEIICKYCSYTDEQHGQESTCDGAYCATAEENYLKSLSPKKPGKSSKVRK